MYSLFHFPQNVLENADTIHRQLIEQSLPSPQPPKSWEISRHVDVIITYIALIKSGFVQEEASCLEKEEIIRV